MKQLVLVYLYLTKACVLCFEYDIVLIGKTTYTLIYLGLRYSLMAAIYSDKVKIKLDVNLHRQCLMNVLHMLTVKAVKSHSKHQS